MTTIQQQLFALRDEKYKAFHSKLIPTIDPQTIIGVRTPELRKLAKQIEQEPETQEFLHTLPHRYYEENNLHDFLLERIKDYPTFLAELNAFLPYIDNWATCDGLRPKCVKKHLPEFLQEIRSWMQSERTYTVRFGINMLMSFYLDDAFQEEYLSWVAQVQSKEYYVQMMQAWYFATALAKQWDSTILYLQNDQLGTWVHNKTIQKAIESRRISAQQKQLLRTLKR